MTVRVLQVITDRDRRGAQVFANDLGAFLVARGLAVSTVALWPGASEKKLDVPALSARRGGLAFLGPLQAEMHHADIVVAHGSRTLMASALASLRVPTPVIYRQISDLAYWANGPLRLARVRMYLRRMSHVVALWADSAQVLRDKFGVSADKISIIANGASPDVFRPPTREERQQARRRFGLDADARVVLCVNALVPEKGVHLAIEALGRISDTKLMVVGHGPYLAELQRLATRVRPDGVVFCGPLDDVLSAYHAADLLVLPSYTEVMPAVVIEAGLCGLPVVATRVGAVPTMIRGGVTGFLVDHDPVDIARAVEAAFGDHHLGGAARNYCLSKFALDPIGRAWLAVLQTQAGSSLTPVG